MIGFKTLLLGSLLCALTIWPASSNAQNADWESWKAGLKKEVIAKGIKPEFANRVIGGLSYDSNVVSKDSNQVSSKYSFAEYKKKAVNPNRVQNGRDYYRKHKQELDMFAAREGVPAEVIVALLGIETDYGGYLGDYDVLRSVASIAYGSKRKTTKAQQARRKYFRVQTFHALKLLQDGVIQRQDFKGSWAGAFGINQHMPESFYSYVVDGDNDGDKEIMNKNDLSDVFATTANHLKKVRWKTGERWGRKVKLPANFSKALIGNKIKKPIAFWNSNGVTQMNGQPLPVVAGMQGSIIAPDGVNGEVYIGYENFHAFRRWNKSDYFALVVGNLSDRIAQR